MSDDAQLVIGKWMVQLKGWIWEYEFFSAGKVTWRDTRSNEKGVGRWTLSPKYLNISWSDSPTTESWTRPLTKQRQKGWYSATYFTGNYEVQKIVDPALRGATDVDPSVAGLPFERYVDAYVDLKYDVNYKIPANKSFAFSTILQARYNDGVVVEFDIDTDFSAAPMTSAQARDAVARALVGRGGRITPHVMNSATTPRLWRARAEALRAQDEEANAFTGLAISATAFVLSVPAMPVGAMPEAAILARTVSRRSVPSTPVPPAPIQGNIVRLGTGNTPGTLFASIQQTASEVVYRVDFIILKGPGLSVATARATHRAMIRRAAFAARSQGQPTFKMVGKQANSEFVEHAEKLAKSIGVQGSGKAGRANPIMHPDYEVTLDVAKTLAQ